MDSRRMSDHHRWRRVLRHWLATMAKNHWRTATSSRSRPRLRQALTVASCTASWASFGSRRKTTASLYAESISGPTRESNADSSPPRAASISPASPMRPVLTTPLYDAPGGSKVPPSHNRRMATALSLTHLGSLMRGVRSVDEVGADERAASLAKRSIKKPSKLWALDLAVRCMDLTTLEGADTPGKVAAMCAKAIRPKPGDSTIPSVAAACVYPLRIADFVEHLRCSDVRISSLAMASPSGQIFTLIKLVETELAFRD